MSSVGVTLVLMNRKELDQAAAHFRAALALDPGYADAHNKLGAVLTWQGRLEEAASEFRRTLELEPGNRQARANLALVEKQLRQRR